MKDAAELGGVVEGDALLAAREKRNLIGKPIVVREMPRPPRALTHAGKRREHVACFARFCFATSAFVLVTSIGVLHESVTELARPLHWSEVVRLGVIPLHGAALALVAFAHRRRVLHHGGKWLRGGRASYRAWRDIDVSMMLMIASSFVFSVKMSSSDVTGRWLTITASVAAVTVTAMLVFGVLLLLRARVLPRGSSQRAWLRAGS